MSEHTLADSLHRLVKEAIDSGAADSVSGAESMFRGFTLSFAIDADQAADPVGQATLLTGVALARRVFLGGVCVSGAVDAPLISPLPLSGNLSDAIVELGGTLGPGSAGTPAVTIGGGPCPRRDGFHVRTVAAGWRGGILPAYSELVPEPGPAMPLAGVLAAALAVNEAFSHVRREGSVAGRRSVGMSLWDPSSAGWLGSHSGEPTLQFLPSRLWLIGLGHLGQAYLWCLGLLPYPDPSGISLVLQDFDRVTPSTESTSVLTDHAAVGLKKTRLLAGWAERRGFETTIHERLFDGSFARQDSEPAIALCGVDNALARRDLDRVGFRLVVEAGLGRGHRDFRSIRMHTLPGPRPAAELWIGDGSAEDTTDRAAYRRLIDDGELDRCGATVLAGKGVGAPFVGAVAGCLVLSEVLRLLHGGSLHHVIDLDLQGVEHRSVVARKDGLAGFNPGYVRVAENASTSDHAGHAA
jgi:hypothetical protein